ncbi:MAG: hypothetical protein II359_07345 [Clostridia bacterium]|nr:hypothetical protein [Clostridia bacterium]
MFLEHPDLTFGYANITNIHPLVWAAPIGELTKVALHFDAPWLVPLFISTVQHVAAILLISYTVSSLKKMKLPPVFLAIVLAFYILLPPMFVFSSVLQNDFLYSLSFQLMAVEFFHYLYDSHTYFKSIKHMFLTALSVFGTILRYNGIYTVLVVLLCVLLREVCLALKKKTKTSHIIALFLIIAIPLTGGQILQKTLDSVYDAIPMTTRIKYALPIQQSARCLATYGTAIPEDIYNDLHTVLLWGDEELAEKYNPINYDGVKKCFKTDATNEEIRAFLSAWLKLVFMYPKDCIAATANQTYFLFSPFADNTHYCIQSTLSANSIRERYNFEINDYLFPGNQLLEAERYMVLDILTKEYNAFPFIGLLDNQAIYTILLFGIFFSLWFREDKRALLLSIAPLVTLGITILGPTVYKHPRYTYPIMFCMPILIAAFAIGNKKNNK